MTSCVCLSLFVDPVTCSYVCFEIVTDAILTEFCKFSYLISQSYFHASCTVVIVAKKKKQRWFCILIWQVTECILFLISLHLDLQDKYGQHWRQNSDKSIKKCPLFFLWRHFLFSGRLLFWTNSAGRVESSRTDGSDRTAIVESIDGPTGVTLQLQEKQVYFSVQVRVRLRTINYK